VRRDLVDRRRGCPAPNGIGAGTGWLIDKLHKGKRPAALPVAVDIRANPRERAVRLQWRF
jgi:hypothetical protein